MQHQESEQPLEPLQTLAEASDMQHFFKNGCHSTKRSLLRLWSFWSSATIRAAIRFFVAIDCISTCAIDVCHISPTYITGFAPRISNRVHWSFSWFSQKIWLNFATMLTQHLNMLRKLHRIVAVSYVIFRLLHFSRLDDDLTKNKRIISFMHMQQAINVVSNTLKNVCLVSDVDYQMLRTCSQITLIIVDSRKKFVTSLGMFDCLFQQDDRVWWLSSSG